MDMADIILSYGDNILRESDVELLRGSFWLNDNVISFYFEYLTREVFKNNSEILFIGPEVTLCLKAAKDSSEISIFLEPLTALEKDLIFFAFNDNRMFEKSGGTHWTLLIYCKQDETFYHLDSIKGSNFLQATKFAGKMLKYFTHHGKGDFLDLDCLQQENSYDCGIFVIAHARYLAREWIHSPSCLSDYEIIDKDEVSDLRQKILDLIISLKKN